MSRPYTPEEIRRLQLYDSFNIPKEVIRAMNALLLRESRDSERMEEGCTYIWVSNLIQEEPAIKYMEIDWQKVAELYNTCGWEVIYHNETYDQKFIFIES